MKKYFIKIILLFHKLIKKNNDKKRNLKQFLKDQEEYQQKKIEKISNIKDTQSKKEEEELKLKPKIQKYF